MEEHNICLTRGLYAVYARNDGRYLFLIADQKTDFYLSLQTLLMQRMFWNIFSRMVI